jgi:hypothetical protein
MSGTNEQTNRSKVKAESKWKKNTWVDLLELFIINVGGNGKNPRKMKWKYAKIFVIYISYPLCSQ